MAGSMSNTCDRRVAKTKAALRGALTALMEERGLDAISVGDLCSAADITRATFYNHFKSKEDLVESVEDEILAELEAIQARLSTLNMVEAASCVKRKRPLPILVDLFDYLRSQGDFLCAVMGPGGDARFERRLRDRVCTTLVQSVLHKRYREHPTAFVNYYVVFYASAYLGVVEQWLETGMRESSGQMARVAQRLLFIKPGESIEL